MKLFPFNKIQFLAGILFLLIGASEYLFSRMPGSAYFLNPFHSIVLSLHGKINPFGELGFQAPDFFHPLAFALMCMALLPNTLKSRILICLAWFGINGALELAQKYGTTLAEFLSQWIYKSPVIENLPNRLIPGTFDGYDLLAIAAGTLTAFLIGQLTRGGRNDERTI